MDPGMLAHLEQRRAEVDAALAETRRSLKRARGARDSAVRASARAWQLPPRLRDTTLIIYDGAGYDAEPAVRFLAREGRRRGWPPKSEGDLQDLVESVFLAAHARGAPQLAVLVTAADPPNVPATRAAQSWLEEWRVFAWSRTQNIERGVAPPTTELLQRLAAERLAAGHASPYARGTVSSAKARMWATRFRRRWGGHFGAIRECEHHTPEELLAKAFGSHGPAVFRADL
jgi:hypothetical protein